MAGVTALRDAARAAIFSCGGRGFVRFVPKGDALLISDAPRRCADQAEIGQMICALESAGFSCGVTDGLAYITPGCGLLAALCETQPREICVNWDSPLYAAQALCARLLRETPQAPDEAAQRLLVETARILWLPQAQMLDALDALRAMIALRMRTGNRSGLYETGRLLCGRLSEIKTARRESDAD